jgi:hypothetical protein
MASTAESCGFVITMVSQTPLRRTLRPCFGRARCTISTE